MTALSGLNALFWAAAIVLLCLAVYYIWSSVMAWLTWRGQRREATEQAFFLRLHVGKLKDRIVELEKQINASNKRKDD